MTGFVRREYVLTANTAVVSFSCSRCNHTWTTDEKEYELIATRQTPQRTDA